MQNRDRYKLMAIVQHEDGQDIILRYIPDAGDPKYDDLPSERLTEGKEYDLTFTERNPAPPPEFNR